MKCKNCGNKAGFMAVVTDYKPLELWEFNEGSLTRYCQKDSGDTEMSIQCSACGSEDIDQEGFDTPMYTDRPLVILSEGEWEQKTSEFKKSEPAEEEEKTEEEEKKD